MFDMLILVDVRTKEEFDQYHIPESVSLPLDQLLKGELGSLSDIDKTTPLEVFCQSGGRAVYACEILKDMGFTAVAHVGGINDVDR